MPSEAPKICDERAPTWTFVKGSYEVQGGRPIADHRVTTAINV